jgi:opacity protein-like surface antigen
MNKRLLTAVCAFALLAFAAPADAARSKKRYESSSAGTSRSCLTSSARALLGRIESQFGRMQIVSTCRPGARIAGTGKISRHASGNAVDFDAGGRKAAVVRWLIANHKSGGTMTYSGMSHIHVDIGQHFVSLGSGGGGGSYRSSRRRYASESSGRHRTASHRGDFSEGRSALGMGSRQRSTYRESEGSFRPSAARHMPSSP